MTRPAINYGKKASAKSYEWTWNTDKLNVLPTTAESYGKNYETTARRVAEQRKNFSQLKTYAFPIADEEQRGDHYGFMSRMAYETGKAYKELRIVQEKLLVNVNQGSQAPSDSNQKTGKMAGLLVLAEDSNVNKHAAGVNGAFTKSTGLYSARTDTPDDADLRKLDADIFNSVADSLFDNSKVMGHGKMLMMSRKQRRAAGSILTGIAELRIQLNGKGENIVPQNIDGIKTDTGTYKLMINRWMRDKDIFFLNRMAYCVKQMWDIRARPLPIIGVNRRQAFDFHINLEVENSASIGLITDLKLN